MKCPQCQAENEEVVKFCLRCGSILSTSLSSSPSMDKASFCPECGTLAQTGADFCGECGESLTLGYADSTATSARLNTTANRIYCPRCGRENLQGVEFCTGCGGGLNVLPSATGLGSQKQNRTSGKPSAAWWLVPIFFAWIGGLIAFLAVKDDDRTRAKHLLVLGLVITGFWIVVYIGLMIFSISGSSW